MAKKRAHAGAVPAELRPQTIAEIVSDRMEPFRIKALEYKANAEAIVVTDASQKELMAQAKEMRLKLRSIRVDSDKLRAELKADSLNTGRVIQSIYNEIEGLIKPLEEHLQTQEDFVKIQEANRIKVLQQEREKIFISAELQDFVPGAFWVQLYSLTDDDIKELIETCVAKKQAKAKAEIEAKEKAEREEKERQELLAENERLRKENEAKEAQLKSTQPLYINGGVFVPSGIEGMEPSVRLHVSGSEVTVPVPAPVFAPTLQMGDKAQLEQIADAIDSLKFPVNLESKAAFDIYSKAILYLTNTAKYIRENSKNL